MIAELLERGHLGSNRDHLSEDFYLGRTALDCEPSGSRSLEPDEKHRVLRIWQAPDQMMLDASTCDHAARGDDDARKLRVVDFLGVFRSLREGEASPLQG